MRVGELPPAPVFLYTEIPQDHGYAEAQRAISYREQVVQVTPQLAVIVPSFGRPANAWRLVNAFEETCVFETQVIFVLDEEDPSRPEYPHPHIVTATRGMIPALNAAARVLAEEYEWIGFMGDDHLPRTPGWDARYRASLEALGTGFVYGNDLIQGARIPTQVAMTSSIVRELGWMAPPTFKHLFVDDCWLALGNGIKAIQYLPDVIIEHLHPLGGTAENDENYDRVNDPLIARDDQREFTRWRNMELNGLITRLAAL